MAWPRSLLPSIHRTEYQLHSCVLDLSPQRRLWTPDQPIAAGGTRANPSPHGGADQRVRGRRALPATLDCRGRAAGHAARLAERWHRSGPVLVPRHQPELLSRLGTAALTPRLEGILAAYQPLVDSTSQAPIGAGELMAIYLGYLRLPIEIPAASPPRRRSCCAA